MENSLACADYEKDGYCQDGSIVRENPMLQNESFFDVLFEEEHGTCGLTARTACCACGGGIRPDDAEISYRQLEEWKIVLGDGSPQPSDQAPKEASFYDDDFWNDTLTFDDDLFKEEETSVPSYSPSQTPTEKKTLRPTTAQPTQRQIFQGTFDEIIEQQDEGTGGMFSGIKNFFSNLFGGGSKDDDENSPEGEKGGSKASSIIAWIITIGFSILLLMRGSSLCNFHVNFSREIRNSG
jgi:hypothetical protein